MGTVPSLHNRTHSPDVVITNEIPYHHHRYHNELYESDIRRDNDLIDHVVIEIAHTHDMIRRHIHRGLHAESPHPAAVSRMFSYNLEHLLDIGTCFDNEIHCFDE
jgi:hypothetical protein